MSGDLHIRHDPPQRSAARIWCVAVVTAVLWLAALTPNSSVAQQRFTKDLLNLPGNFASEEEREEINRVIDRILNDYPDGMTGSWRNPETGTFVIAKPTESYEYEELYCRRLRLRTGAGGETRNWRFNYCQVDDGSWKFAP